MCEFGADAAQKERLSRGADDEPRSIGKKVRWFSTVSSFILLLFACLPASTGNPASTVAVMSADIRRMM